MLRLLMEKAETPYFLASKACKGSYLERERERVRERERESERERYITRERIKIEREREREIPDELLGGIVKTISFENVKHSSGTKERAAFTNNIYRER